MTGKVLGKDEVIARERDGHVIVYRRAGTKHNSNLHYRLRVPNIKNRYERRTTGTPDPHEAIQIARERYDELRARQRRKVTVFTKAFADLAEAYLVDLEHRLKIGAKGVTQSVYDLADWTTRTYFLPFWGKKEVDNFTGTDIAEFHKWRMQQWEANKDKVRHVKHGVGHKRRYRNSSIKKPSAQSQARDEGVFNQIMRYGVVNRWLTPAEVPAYDRTKPDKKRRAGFDEDEFSRLLAHLEMRITEAETGENERIIHQRRIIYDYVRFLAYSGLRVGECRFLRLRDVERYALDDSWADEEGIKASSYTAEELGFDEEPTLEEAEALLGGSVPFMEQSGYDAPHLPWEGFDGREVRITVPDGKTGARKIIGQPDIIEVRDRILSYHPDPSPNAYLWVNHKGQHIRSFKETFAALLDDLELRIADAGIHKGARRSLYSLRHFYATQRLRAGVDIYLLAKNMGTSVHQIERYYSDVLVEREAKRITMARA